MKKQTFILVISMYGVRTSMVLMLLNSKQFGLFNFFFKMTRKLFHISVIIFITTEFIQPLTRTSLFAFITWEVFIHIM